VAQSGNLDAAAEALGLGDSEFVDFRPGEFINDRTWNGR